MKKKASEVKGSSGLPDPPNQLEQSVNVHPIHNEPAFIIEKPPDIKGNAMVLADLHYGIEHSLTSVGAHLPSQSEKITQHILKLCSKFNISDLILLGDIKHNVPGTSRQEWYELPDVFRDLSRALDCITIIPGNHDGGLRKLIPSNLTNIHFFPIYGVELFGLGLFHGHAWPAKQVLRSKYVLMGHNHPHVLFVDKLGGRASYPCWVRAHFNKDLASTRYPELEKLDITDHDQNWPELIILPAFNDLGGGTPITAPEPEYLGPMLKNKFIDIDNAEIYLLDGTALGKLHEITKLNSAQVREKNNKKKRR